MFVLANLSLKRKFSEVDLDIIQVTLIRNFVSLIYRMRSLGT